MEALVQVKMPSICVTGTKQKPLEKDAGSKTLEWLEKLRNSNGSLPTSKIRLNMQRIMQNNAAVFRTQETLAEGMLDAPHLPDPRYTLNVVVISHIMTIDTF